MYLWAVSPQLGNPWQAERTLVFVPPQPERYDSTGVTDVDMLTLN